MGYQKILAAVDLTEETDDVLQRAAELGKQYGAELSLLTVVRSINHVYGGFDVAALSADAALIERDVTRQAEEHVRRHGKALDVPEERCYVAHGSPSLEIKHQAEKLGVGLIVMGTHGRKGFGLLLGSTATGVLHGSPCDVLTVRIK